jgi:EamA domain-containing membrane protein RarD
VSLYAYINPLIAVLLGAIFASEPLTYRVIAAVALVFSGVAMVRTARRVGS